MRKLFKTVEDYLAYLEEKGFVFGEDAKGFIEFGKGFTGCDDIVVISAIEITLKVQRTFDGSFFVSFLEVLKEHKAKNRNEAYIIAKNIGIIN